MRILIAAIAFACVGSTVARYKEENWKEFVFKKCGFSIAFPGMPETRSGIVSWRENGGKPFWMLANAEKSERNFNGKRDAMNFLEGAQGGILNNEKGKIATAKDPRTGGTPWSGLLVSIGQARFCSNAFASDREATFHSLLLCRKRGAIMLQSC